MAQWHRFHDECKGQGWIELSVDEPEGPYPALVHLEVEPGSLLPYDAREYALALLAAAEVADQRNDRGPEQGDREQ